MEWRVTESAIQWHTLRAASPMETEQQMRERERDSESKRENAY